MKGKKYQPIIGTLAYIINSKDEVLLVYRKRSDDVHMGKYNGVGGKLLRNEDIYSGICREVNEETGLEVKTAELRGSINWQDFSKNKEDWLGFVFLIRDYTGTAFSSNEEGTLAWHKVKDLDKLAMWEGDRYFLPMVFDAEKKIFHATMRYENDKVAHFSYSR